MKARYYRRSIGRFLSVDPVDDADLIYPGADMFYGHGFIVDYDIDYLPARVGWAPEDITFHSFGFREGVIDEMMLLTFARVWILL